VKKKKMLILLAGAALLGAAGVFLFGKQGLIYPYRQPKLKEREIEENRRIIDSLKEEIKRLTNDTAYIERIAREKLGMARLDEKVYKFVEKRK
jgi:cell division protein FtsB